MKIKIIIIIFISAIIILALLYFLFFNNKSTQDIITLLKLPITEDQILKKESRADSNNSTTLILYVDHNIQFEKYPLFDIDTYKGSTVYDDLAAFINENDMSIDEAEIRFHFVQYSIKNGLFSELVFADHVYIITGNNNYTIIYTNIPKGVALPRDYRP